MRAARHGGRAATVREADAVFVVVLTDEQVRAVCLGRDGAIAAMRSHVSQFSSRHTGVRASRSPARLAGISSPPDGAGREPSSTMPAGPSGPAAGNPVLDLC